MGDESDAYAKQYMEGSGKVLLLDKARSRVLLGVLGLAAILNGGGAVATLLGALPKSSPGVAALLAVMTAFFALLAVTMTVVRTVVSEREVHVQLGLWGPRVPIERVLGCRVTPYDWTKFGGFGIRRSFDGTWAYVMGRGEVVELRFTDDAGAERTVLFSAADPHAVAAAVARSRAAAQGPRVALGATAPSRARIAAEAEEELVDDEARAERARRS
jgi:hypothetical protein